MSRANKDDIAVGLAALVLAGVYAFFALDIAHSFLADPVGAAGLPKLYAIGLGLLALLLVARSRTPRSPAKEMTEASAHRVAASRHLRAVGLLLPGAAYLLLISSLGYFAAIFLLLIGVTLYAGAKPGIRLISISVLGASAMWVIFDRLFNIPLPTGSVWPNFFH